MIEVLTVTPVSLSYLVLGGFVVAFSMVSLVIKEKIFIGEVVLGTAFGVIIGPYCANIFNPRGWGSSSNDITLEVMRFILATGLFAIGVELPGAYLAEHAKSLLITVVPAMAFGWAVCGGLLKLLFPHLNFVSALVISACLTPTDPVLAAAIIGGKFAIKNVPGHVRHLLAAESACNDGLAYPFLSLAMYLIVETSTKAAVGKFFLVGCLYQVILGTVLGAVIGLCFSHLMRFSHQKGLIDRESFVAQYLSLAIFTIGVASTLGTDDLLAAFAAGSAVSWDQHFNAHTEDEVFSSVIDLLLNCAGFIYIGAWLPFNDFNSPDLGITPGRLVTLFIAILCLRRIPAFMVLYPWVPDIRTWREALFCGHFGPMGVGAIFISTLAIKRLPLATGFPENHEQVLSESLHPIVGFIVLCSIIVHGLSIPAFWFGRKAASRTVSLSNSWSRSRTSTTRQPAEVPDWLLWARRAPGVKGGPSQMEEQPEGTEHRSAEADVERSPESPSSVDETILAGDPNTVGSPKLGEHSGMHPGGWAPRGSSLKRRVQSGLADDATIIHVYEEDENNGSGNSGSLKEGDELRHGEGGANNADSSSSSLKQKGVANDSKEEGERPVGETSPDADGAIQEDKQVRFAQ